MAYTCVSMKAKVQGDVLPSWWEVAPEATKELCYAPFVYYNFRDPLPISFTI